MDKKNHSRSNHVKEDYNYEQIRSTRGNQKK